MGVNSLLKTVAPQRRDCDLNSGPSAPESSTLTTRLPSHRVLTGTNQFLLKYTAAAVPSRDAVTNAKTWNSRSLLRSRLLLAYSASFIKLNFAVVSQKILLARLFRARPGRVGHGQDVGRATQQSRVRLPAVPLSASNLGQVVRTHVPLSPSRFGTGQEAATPCCGWEGNRWSGVALATRHTQWFIHLPAHGLCQGDDHPAYTPHTTYSAVCLSCAPSPAAPGATPRPCFRQCCGRGVLHGVVVSGEVPVAAQLWAAARLTARRPACPADPCHQRTPNVHIQYTVGQKVSCSF